MKKNLVLIRSGEIFQTFSHPDDLDEKKANDELFLAWGEERYLRNNHPDEEIYLAELNQIPRRKGGKLLERYVNVMHLSVGEVTKMYPELKVFDYAIPQGWVDMCVKRGFDPRGKTVWCYDQSRLGGLPFFLTWEALCDYRAKEILPAV